MDPRGAPDAASTSEKEAPCNPRFARRIAAVRTIRSRASETISPSRIDYDANHILSFYDARHNSDDT
ncbi:hypothetical protein GCM10010489_04100 [Microbacterium saperdae]|nr:hypothetical protein GCM10010489_04100 [Microbacterium saperdae]